VSHEPYKLIFFVINCVVENRDHTVNNQKISTYAVHDWS